MSKKLTITVEDTIYEQLYRKIGARKIGKFLQELARPYLEDDQLDKAYAEMAQDTDREQEAATWSDNLLFDIAWNGEIFGWLILIHLLVARYAKNVQPLSSVMIPRTVT